MQATTVWAGTDDGLIHVTRDDGKTWNNVTPPAMTAWSKVSQIEAGHFDVGTAYASVDRHRLADNKPYIYRTHDGGKTWQNVVAGIPEGAYVNSVKEDPQAKGLLYAATELRVYVSFNDGAQWQPLQNNMPVTSVRDIVVHGDDLDIATHGRGFWVLDQMSALRQIAAQGAQIRVRATPTCSNPARPTRSAQGGMNGTPLPHEEPQELNPPSGVVAYYWLKTRRRAAAENRDCWTAPERCAPAPPATRRCVRWIPKPSTCRRSGSSPRSRLRPLPGCIASRSAAPADAEAVVVADAAAAATPPVQDACTAGAADAEAAGRRTAAVADAADAGGLRAGPVHGAPDRGWPDYTQPVTVKAGSARHTRWRQLNDRLPSHLKTSASVNHGAFSGDRTRISSCIKPDAQPVPGRIVKFVKAPAAHYTSASRRRRPHRRPSNELLPRSSVELNRMVAWGACLSWLDPDLAPPVD